MCSIGIIDLGVGNITSVAKALHHLNQKVVISRDPGVLELVDKLILPGVGSYKKAAQSIAENKLKTFLCEIIPHKPTLGICLGMQILSTYGYEHGDWEGLGLIPGAVSKMDTSERTPHVGWNSIVATSDSPLFEGIPNGACFYFTHSYHFVPAETNHIAATTDHGITFCSAVSRADIFGVQFHPEKSQQFGLTLLKNFTSLK